MLKLIIRASIFVILFSSVLMFMYQPTLTVFVGMILLWACVLLLTPKGYMIAVKKPVSKDDTDTPILTITQFPKDFLKRNPILDRATVPLKIVKLDKSATTEDVYDRLYCTGARSE
jgi:hypothetical protein